MSTIDRQDALKGDLSPDLHPERCLNARHSEAGCSHCVQTCPVRAIRQSGPAVEVDEEQCRQCGVCVAVCPTGVFSGRDWSERNLLEALRRAEGATALLSCVQHDHPEGEGERLRVRGCLAALTPGLLFEAALLRPLKLRVDRCAGCGWSAALAQVEHSVELANSWLVACGREEGVALAQAVSVEAPARPRPWFRRSQRGQVVAVDEPIESRRDFLIGFARSGSPLFAACLGFGSVLSAFADQKASPARRRPSSHHLPQWRAELRAAYTQASGSEPGRESCASRPSAAAVWPNVIIGESCTACGACELHCPTGAISSKASAEGLTRIFTAGVCVDCGVCALGCPSGAVSRGYATCERPFDSRAVAHMPTQPCMQCGSPTPRADRLCYWCSSVEPLGSVLDSARRALLVG